MKIPISKYDITVEILCLICLLGGLLFLIISWNSVPDQIPGHYNATGQIDRIADKSTLVVIYIFMWIVYIGLSLIEKYPQIWNTGVKITEQNRDKVYRNIKDLLETGKLIFIAIFTYLTVNTAFGISLPSWFTPVSVVLILGTLTFFIVRLVKSNKI